MGLVVQLRALGAEVRVCAPPDCAERLAEVDVPLVPVGQPVRPLMHGATPPSAVDVPRRAAELIAAQFDKLTAAGALSVAERAGHPLRYASYCPGPRSELMA
jgi:vancomycin aglycone glucosyltransferase